MTARTMQAPGKMMLCGEYAVLDGAPALLACAGPMVTARIETIERSPSIVETRLDTDQNWHFSFGDELRWAKPNPPMLIDALLREFPPLEPCRLSVDSSAFFAEGRKLGLGSSAAVAVAVGAVLGAAIDAEAVAKMACAHRVFQGDSGSGADVHAIATGGVVQFEQGAATSLPAPPEALTIQPIIAKASVSTVNRIARFRSWQQTARAAGERLEALGGCARELLRRWRAGDNPAIMEGFRDYLARMSEVSDAAGLDYLGGGHAQLMQLAQDCGVAYKPCGAGGGDLGFAVAIDAEQMRRFRQLAVDAGFAAPAWPVGTVAPRGDAARGAIH
ncbi:MAG: hypothetical protein AAFQ16_00110 [Pseudomonadota bacterium]